MDFVCSLTIAPIPARLQTMFIHTVRNSQNNKVFIKKKTLQTNIF